MKRFITLISVLFLTIGLTAQEKPKDTPQKDPNAAVMTVENPTINYGELMKGEDDGVRYFKFKNTGKSPLKIIKVRSTCGCTVPTPPKQEIMPGEESQIMVKYNMRPGRFSKSITVMTNGNPERVVLRIKGTVIDPNAPIKKEKPMMSADKK